MSTTKHYPDPGWTTLVDGTQATLRWIHPGGKQVAYILRRPDGRFTKWTEYYSEDEYELCWIPQEMSGSFYDTEETAVREMHGMLPWTVDVEPERRVA